MLPGLENVRVEGIHGDRVRDNGDPDGADCNNDHSGNRVKEMEECV